MDHSTEHLAHFKQLRGIHAVSLAIVQWWILVGREVGKGMDMGMVSGGVGLMEVGAEMKWEESWGHFPVLHKSVGLLDATVFLVEYLYRWICKCDQPALILPFPSSPSTLSFLWSTYTINISKPLLWARHCVIKDSDSWQVILGWGRKEGRVPLAELES